MATNRARRAGAALASLLAGTGVLIGAAAAPAHAAELNGLFALTSGACTSSGATGTYFRMINPTGTPGHGPYLDNSDSTCAQKSFTLLPVGSDGGLELGSYQSEPSPAFDSAGNSLSKRIVTPVNFFGVKFGLSTNAKDPQTGQATKLPELTISGGKVSGDLSAFAASWNKQEFNQGSPKPDGSRPGITQPVSGTYDASTGHLAITWTSQIVGGPFDKFTGEWHLSGTFRPSGAGTGAPASQPTAAGTTTSANGGTTAAAPTSVPSARPASSAEPSAVPSTEAAAAPTDQTASAAPSAPSTTEVASTTRTGTRAPRWAVVLVAALGALAIGAYVLIDRTLHKDGAA